MKKENFLRINTGTMIFFLGLLFLIIYLFYTKILGLAIIEIIYYIALVGMCLLYLGACLHIILIEDTPFSKSWQYIKESRNFILLTVILFLSASIVALYYQPQFLVDAIKKFIEELLARTANLSVWEMTIFIFSNNLKSSFFGMIFGLFFGIFPVFTSLANGYILGFIAEKTAAASGLSILWRIFPHGVFELPALFLSLGLGMKLGFFMLARNKKREFLRRLEGSLRVFLFVILPLLVIAAIIEGVMIFLLE